MKEEHRVARSIDDNRHLIAYGVGGDYIGARRSRRAFRLLVIVVAGIGFSLYFVEQYLRYDLNEVQYRMALTLQDDSQRAILRNVVQRDAEDRDVPTAKYVEALAYIEEDDIVLERFAEAAKLAPDKGSLLIVYGCKLFQQGRYKESRQILREATLKTTRNALPKYLQAAALVASSPTEEDFRTAMALLARASDSGEEVIFPQPLWHETLPKGGDWYEVARRDLVERCTAPLYFLKNAMITRAHEAMKAGDVQGWDAWLQQLQQMGARLVGGPESDPVNIGVNQAICGLSIQDDTLEARIALAEFIGKAAPAELIARQLKIQEAMSRVERFEQNRLEVVATSSVLAEQPLWLVFYGLLILAASFLLLQIICTAFQTDKNARALRQTRLSISVVGLWLAALAITLLLLYSLEHSENVLDMQFMLEAWWYFLLLAILVFSLVYPALVLPRPADVCQNWRSEPGYADKLLVARRSRRKAYLSMSGRLIGIALGTYIIVISVFFVGHRIVTGLYPTDVALLISGMGQEELAMLREIQQMLSKA